jgi:hypothetical protein
VELFWLPPKPLSLRTVVERVLNKIYSNKHTAAVSVAYT